MTPEWNPNPSVIVYLPLFPRSLLTPLLLTSTSLGPALSIKWERNTTVVPEPVIRYGFTRSERLTKGMRDVRTHRSILLSGYTVGGIDYFIALWERRLEPDPAPPLPNTFGLLDLSRDRLERLKEQLMYQGVIPRSLSGYNAAGHFAATWESLFYSAEDAVNIDNHVGQFTNWGTRIPALSVAITKDERLVYASGFGLASRWDAIPQIMVSPRTRFRIASVSKIITATAIMTLVEAGRIHLSDHVFGPSSLTGDRYATYVPHRPNVDPNILEHQYEYSAGIEDITVQHLLEHTSGWDDISNPIIIINVDRWDSIRIIEDTVANVPLAHPPGTHFDYSNFGFLVLGQLIADLTNTDYETYVRTAVLDPAGVSPRFQLASNDGQLPDEVTYYPLDLTNANRWHEYGAFGGWVGTPIDLMRFSVHVDGMPGRKDVLNATTEGAMWAPSQVEPTQSLGWWGDEEEKFRGHDGELPDARSWLIQKTDGSGYGFAVCINVGTAKEWTVDKPDWWKVGATELREMVEGLIKLVKWPEYDLF